MRRLVYFLVLCCYLFSATEARELLKLPILFEHFAEHKQLDGKLSMWEFLCIHYAHGDVRDADYEKDMKLPFKTSSTHHSDNPLSFFVKTCSLPTVLTFTNRTFLNHTPSSKILSNHLESIWQPPKYC